MKISAETPLNSELFRNSNDMISGDIGIIVNDDEGDHTGVVVIKTVDRQLMMISGDFAGQRISVNCYVRVLGTGESVVLTAEDDDIPF